MEGGGGIVRTSGKILSPWNGYRNTTFYRQETRTQLRKLRSQLRESFLIWFHFRKSNMIYFIYISQSFMLGLGQTNFSWDEPNLVSHVHEKFDVWLNYM